jgi:hypothetical protein
MFGSAELDRIDPSLIAAKNKTFSILVDAIVKDQQCGLCVDGEAELIAIDAWVRAHGLATLVISGQIDHQRTPPLPLDELMRLIFRVPANKAAFAGSGRESSP